MRGRRHKLQVSTFPFLAVLLCAMGSLILVLLVMDRKAHQAAVARAQREAARLAEETARTETERQGEIQRLQEQKREDLHTKLSNEQLELETQMKKVRDQLRDIAARLHYEQDTTTALRRKVQDKRDRLQAEQRLLLSLRSNSEQTAAQSQEANKTLQRMTIDLLQMEQALKDLQASKKREQQTFSVVPYHGRRGESRRPIYVECSAQGVIFHPERRAMPVTSDVRQEVERRIAVQRAKLARLPGNSNSTPYLLLLLRPEGVETYHVFQAVLRGLDLDFGYEFIDDDWILDFPADDELPSAQPWMIASKSPAPSAAAASPISPAKPGNRPVGLAPATTPRGAFKSDGLRGFQGHEGGTGLGFRGSPSPGGSGTGEGVAGGSGPTNGEAGGAWAGMSVLGSNRGGGRGHPAALFPSPGQGDSGAELSADGPPTNGFRGTGRFSLQGAGTTSSSGPPMAGGSDVPGLGPPQAPSSQASGNAASGSGTPGASGNGSPGGQGGVSTNNGSGGSSLAALPGNNTGGNNPSALGSSPGGTMSAPGREIIAQSNNGGVRPMGAGNGGGSGQSTSGATGTVSSPQGAGGTSSGSSVAMGGAVGGQQSTAAPPGTNGKHSRAAVIFVDPLTGRPTTAPPPSPNTDGQSGDPPPEGAEDGKAEPRVRVIVGSGAGGGEPGDPESAALHRFDPPMPAPSRPARKPATLRPAWVHGGRDWIVYLECRADGIVLYPSQRLFAVEVAASEADNNPLVKAIQQMIQRRQSARRPNEPPYRPQVCLLVRPENVRTFLRVYRALEALSVPVTRRNIDPDDDIFAIVTGSNP